MCVTPCHSWLADGSPCPECITTLTDRGILKKRHLGLFRAAATGAASGGPQLVMGQFRMPHHIFKDSWNDRYA